MNVITGILFHAVGAFCSALCYTPQKKVQHWSWQTYWMAQAFVCWVLLPFIGAVITIPHLGTVLREAPADAMWKTFLLGIAYGIGGTSFGVAIRHVGFSITYAISIGISCVLGTLLPPLVHGELGTLMSRHGAEWIIVGMLLGIVGIILYGIAGRQKETHLQELHKTDDSFSLKKGLPICFLAGVLSSLYGFALDQGQPIAAIAEKYGAGGFQGNVIYIFSNTGAFFTTLMYCLYLHRQQGTLGEFTKTVQKTGSSSALPFNYVLAIITGLLWYSQFFFYGLGHVRMGTYKFTSWAIHMIMLVIFSNVAAIAFKEWANSKAKTIAILAVALTILIAAVMVLTYGNYTAGAS